LNSSDWRSAAIIVLPPLATFPTFTAGHGAWMKGSTKNQFLVDFLKLRRDATNTFDRYFVEVTLLQ
jgi:hypothetical protein